MPRRKELLIAAFAMLLVAAVPWNARAGCTPEPVVTTQVTEEWSDSDTAVNCENEDDVWSPNDAFHDSGYGRDTTTDTDTTRTEADVYVWAEDGDSAYVNFSAKVARNWTFSTVCHPAASHAVPPYGACDHEVVTIASISYNAGATGGAAQRSGSATLFARMPTGRTIYVDWHTDDEAAEDNTKTARWTVDGEGTFSDVAEVTGSLTKFIGGKIGAMATAGIHGSVEVTHVTKWSENSAASASEIVELVDLDSVLTECHAGPVLGVETSALEGTLDLGPTPSSSDDSFLHGDFKVHQLVMVTSTAISFCGDEVVVPPTTEPGTGTDPGTGGETTPDDPVDPDGGTATEEPTAVGGDDGSTGSDATAEPDPDGATEETDPVDPAPESGEPAPDDPPEAPNGWGLARRAADSGGSASRYRRTV